MYQNQYLGIDARLVSIIRNRSQKLIGHYGIRPDDLPDLHQEWIVQIIGKPEYAEPHHPDFERRIAQLVNLLAIDEIRRRKAIKRNQGRLILSLDYEESNADQRSTLGETISEEDYLVLTDGNSHRTIADQVEASEDTQAFINQLGPDLRQIAEVLKHHQIDHLADQTGLSRATAYRRLQSLREAAKSFFQKMQKS